MKYFETCISIKHAPKPTNPKSCILKSVFVCVCFLEHSYYILIL